MIYQPMPKILDNKNVYVFTKNVKNVSKRFEDGLFHPCSTGWLALNLALIMNPRKIYLYGYDYTGERFFDNYEHHNYDRSDISHKIVFQRFYKRVHEAYNSLYKEMF